MLYAATTDAKMRGFTPSRFSFNVKGGRCEACQGDGIIKIEMHFLSDVYVPCEVCKGKRYNRETLEVKYKGKSINDALKLTNKAVMEALDGLPPVKVHCSVLAEQAIKAAVSDYYKRRGVDPEPIVGNVPECDSCGCEG